MEAANQSRIEVMAQIARQDARPAVAFDPRQQMAHFHVGVAVACVFHFRTPAEERVGFVEQKYDPLARAGIEQRAEVLLGLSDVFAHEQAQVGAEQAVAERAREHFGGEALARTARSGKESERTLAS